MQHSLTFFLFLSFLSGEPEISALQARVPELMEEAKIPGLSLALIREGEIVWTGGFGVRRAGESEAVDADTRFEAASLTKPVVAVATLRLAERGLIDLDKPLAEILTYPRLEHDPRYHRITPRQVLSHSTGLPNWGGERLELIFDPGERFSYSGEGFVFLQKSLEKVLEKPLQAIVEEEVFSSLGMVSSSVAWREAPAENLSHGHDEWGEEARELRVAEEANAAASLITTARDYARFLAALLNRKLLTPGSWKAMLSPAVSTRGSRFGTEQARKAVDWGLGWGLEQAKPMARFWHWGDNGAFKSLVVADANTRNGFVYFTNSSAGLSISAAMLEMLMPESRFISKWLNYESYDAPDRVLRHRLVEAFTSKAAAPFELIRRTLRQTPRPEVAVYTAVSRRLRELGDEERAVKVLQIALESLPREVEPLEELGDALLEAGHYGNALEIYSEAARSASAETRDRLQGKRTWTEQRLKLLEAPVVLARDRLEEYVGDYGPRQVRLEAGVLIYQRQGNPKYPLIPLDEETFALDGLENFRIRFERNPVGEVVKLIGLYLGGREDVSKRRRLKF